MFLSFLFGGHAALGPCLPNLRLMLGHRELCWYHVGLLLSHFGVFCGLCMFVLAFVEQELGPYWAYLAILGYVDTILGSC